MKTILRFIALCTVTGVTFSCSDCQEEYCTSQEQSAFTLNITPQANPEQGTGYNFNDHMNRIYIGVRQQEHHVEELHTYSSYDLYSIDGGKSVQFSAIQMKPQWYKFIVLSVPKLFTDKPNIDARNFRIFTEKVPGAESCNLTDQMIDYRHILDKGPGATGVGEGTPDKDIALCDGDIYRGIINRWIEQNPDLQTEDITLHRINGKLEINMGILADQFNDKILRIAVELNTPTRLFLTDNNRNEVLATDTASIIFTTQPADYRHTAESLRREHIISLNLLPAPLNGTIKVTTEHNENFVYSLDDLNAQIRQNTRTRIRFNGMSQNNFKVEYAGFDDTSIDAHEDWDGGWDNNAQTTGSHPISTNSFTKS